MDFEAFKKLKISKPDSVGVKYEFRQRSTLRLSKTGYMLTRAGIRSNLRSRHLWNRTKTLRLSISLSQNQPSKPIFQKQPRRTAVYRRVRKVKKIIFCQRINLAFRIMNLFTNVRSEAAGKHFQNQAAFLSISSPHMVIR